MTAMAGMASLLLLSWPPEATPRTLQQFTLLIGGSIEMLDEETSQDVDIDRNQTAMNFHHVSFTLTNFWQRLYNISNVQGSTCFSPTHLVRNPEDRASIHLRESKSVDVATAVFWFESAFDGFRYELTLTDTDGWEGTFPPSGTGSAVMTPDTWEMGTDRKGRHRWTACKGTGTFLLLEDKVDLLVEPIPILIP